jgi:hypothetical protein
MPADITGGTGDQEGLQACFLFFKRNGPQDCLRAGTFGTIDFT